MKDVTKQMLKDFKVEEKGYDFMGYPRQGNELINFHHLILPRRLCQGGGEKGYYYWNGALLYETSHQYLHVIERYDMDTFDAITEQMIYINNKGYLDKVNLLYIDDYLTDFESRYGDYKTSKGKPLIKDKYLNRHF